MPTIVIPYRLKQEAPEIYNLIPLCDVRLHGPIRSVPVTAVVDSGAVYSFFPNSAARDAGLSLEKGQPFRANFGGSVDDKAMLLEVYLNIHDLRLKAKIVFVEKLVLGYAMLGRQDIFSRFNEVAFLDRTLKKQVELRY